METPKSREYFEEDIKTENCKFEKMETPKNSSLFDNEYFEEEIKTENDEEEKPNLTLMSHLCNICHKVYKSNAGLSTHIKSVHEENRYSCDQCQYKARAKSDLKRHIQSSQVFL